jgi:type I restriction enzyme S subunit
VPVPPLAEQKRIVAQIELSLSVVDATATTTDASIARSNRLRQSILKWAFEGRLVDQDPNDEPASVLLDRIRAERATLTAATKSRKTNTHQIEAAK